MESRFTGKVAIVTGASRGIGRAIAQTLSAQGMQLVLVARSKDSLKELAATLNAPSLVHAVDLRDSGAAAGLRSAALERFGRLDALVNNAGATARGDFLALTDETWEDGFALKFFGAMRCSRATWGDLRATQGCIVNIVGIGGRTGDEEFTIGGAVNAALLNLTKALADRGVREGVRVNAVNPGGIHSDRLLARLRTFAAQHDVSLEGAEQQMAQSLGVARFGKPSEIASVVAFLASSDAAYCNGSIIDIDGGQTRTL